VPVDDRQCHGAVRRMVMLPFHVDLNLFFFGADAMLTHLLLIAVCNLSSSSILKEAEIEEKVTLGRRSGMRMRQGARFSDAELNAMEGKLVRFFLSSVFVPDFCLSLNLARVCCTECQRACRCRGWRDRQPL
jgi:hypothetical protein